MRRGYLLLCFGILLLLPQALIAGETPVYLIGAGDIAACSSPGDEATARLIEGLIDLKRDAVFTAGDNAYPEGSPEDFEKCYGPSWGRFKTITRPALGNHDYATRGAEGYYQYFGEAARPEGFSFYAFEHGEWLILILNSSIDGRMGESIQGKWLQETLEASPHRCAMAIWHHPLHASTTTQPYRDRPRDVGDLWRVLYQYGVEVVINGHVHAYERFAPQNPDGELDPKRGIRQFIVGTGGAPLNKPPEKRAAHREVFDSSTWGVIRFELRPDSYAWEFFPVEGGTFHDSGEAKCVK
ncbi:MAG: metallophosphoesterase [Anaerolinea sp.]|nr:metallophosphoesterase [Anaerolinea sp.]